MTHSMPELADDGRRAERPILFSGAMMRQIIAGNKTQTRRVAKCLMPYDKQFIHCASSEEWKQKRAEQCPYGKPGDRLWVRETWGRFDPDHVMLGKLFYYAADTLPGTDGDRCRQNYGYKYKPSIHMPRVASRITLEVSDVRVERVQDISEEDAKAEGCVFHNVTGDTNGWYPEGYRINFQGLWNSINEKRGFGWDTNPWVWCVSFRRAERAA